MTPSANYVELIRKLRRTFVKTALAQRMCGSWSKQWLGLSTLNQINMPGSLHKYWRKCRAKIERNQRRSFDGIMIYFWWNIWKEWIEGFFNRRIYNLDKWQCYARMTYNNFRWLLELMSTSLSFPVVFSMFISGGVGRVLALSSCGLFWFLFGTFWLRLTCRCASSIPVVSSLMWGLGLGYLIPLNYFFFFLSSNIFLRQSWFCPF